MDQKSSFFASDAIARAQGLPEWQRAGLMFAMQNEPPKKDVKEITATVHVEWGGPWPED